MKKHHLPNDVKVFGLQVKTFPEGIGEAFDKLVKMFPQSDDRPFYGISECTNEGIIYNAAALETYDGEAEKYGCERYLIQKGDYLTITVMDWQKKTDFIKVVFEELFKNDLSDRTFPCVEIYKNDEEMMCMVKVDFAKETISAAESVAKEMIELLASFNFRQINTIPFEGSWTAAQLADHIFRSNTSIEQSLLSKGKPAMRKSDERVAELKKTFLDFSSKLQAGDFILPTEHTYDDKVLISQLKTSFEQLIKAVSTSDLAEAVDHPALGEITKLEMLHFVVYHTQRHIHQLKNISEKVKRSSGI